MQWLRRSFIAGFFVTVPLFISVAALLWLFRLVDGFVGPLYAKYLGRVVPGLGLLTTALAVVLVGAIATNVVGKRLLQRAESILLRVPLFRSIYAPVKQLVVAFSPDNEFGFKRVVLVEDAHRGFALGFLTREFTVDRGQGPEALLAVYVPTNHLYHKGLARRIFEGGDDAQQHRQGVDLPELDLAKSRQEGQSNGL